MCLSLRQHDSPPSTRVALSIELDRVNASQRSISSWPRRVASSAISIEKAESFIAQHGRSGEEIWDGLKADYAHLARNLLQHGKQLKATVPLFTVYLQMLESRYAYSETKNISRLTVLALIFVPLSFVSSLFSMNEAFGPSGPRFWVFFTVALPISILVLLIAKLSSLRIRFELLKERWRRCESWH